jgi:hypothetical protein
MDAAGAGVAGTEIASGVVSQAGSGNGLGGFALPGALGALRGDEYPLAKERVVAAVRDEIERAGSGGHGGSFEKDC